MFLNRLGSRRELPITLIVLVVLICGCTWVAAQRGDKPASRASAPGGAEIAAAARAGRLDHGKATTATLFNAPFKFTPAIFPAKADGGTEDAGAGAFMGVLENGAPGDETGLPAGKYNLFFANVNGQPKCYAEANGQIVREAIRTTVTPAPAGGNGRPSFQAKGWCVKVYWCNAYFTLTSGGASCQWRQFCY